MTGHTNEDKNSTSTGVKKSKSETTANDGFVKSSETDLVSSKNPKNYVNNSTLSHPVSGSAVDEECHLDNECTTTRNPISSESITTEPDGSQGPILISSENKATEPNVSQECGSDHNCASVESPDSSTVPQTGTPNIIDLGGEGVNAGSRAVYSSLMLIMAPLFYATAYY